MINPTYAQPLYSAQDTAAISSSKTKLSSDFETFLKMLTVQMQNQDPLNPIDSSEYAMQLASFSSVEQQVRTNDLLTDLATQFATQGLSLTSNWVGMDVRSAAPAYFDGTPVELHVDFPTNAGEFTLIVRDEAGDIVDSRSVASDVLPFEWDGVTTSGALVPAGAYSFELEYSDSGGEIHTAPVQNYTRVEEIRFEDGQVVLVLAGGSIISPTGVSALKQAD